MPNGTKVLELDKMENQNPVVFQPSPPSKRKLKIALVIALIIGIIAVILAVTYVMGQSTVAVAAGTFETSTQNFELTNLSLFPPSVDLKADVVVRNPSSIEFTVNKYQADLYVKYGSEVYSIGAIDVADKSLPSNGYVTVPLTMHCGSEVISFLSAHSSDYKIVVSGTASVSGKYLFWTITNEGPVNIEQNAGSPISPIPTPDLPYIIPTLPPTPTPTLTPSSGVNIAISYILTTESNFTWSVGSGYTSTQQADSGKIFVEIKMTVQNNGYASFNTNPYYFYLVTDSIKYTPDSGTYLLDKWSTVDVLNGGTFVGTMLFQVPASASSFTLGYEQYLTTYNIIWTKI